MIFDTRPCPQLQRTRDTVAPIALATKKVPRFESRRETALAHT